MHQIVKCMNADDIFLIYVIILHLAATLNQSDINKEVKNNNIQTCGELQKTQAKQGTMCDLCESLRPALVNALHVRSSGCLSPITS